MHRTAVVLLQPMVRQTRELEALLEAQRPSVQRRAGGPPGGVALGGQVGLPLRAVQGADGSGPPRRPLRSVAGLRTLTRLDRAFQGFFRRLKAEQKPGFPRFKSY